MAFSSVDPNMARQLSRALTELGPVFATFDVTLVGAGSPEGNAKGDYETEDSEQEIGNDERVHEVRDASYQGGPCSNYYEGHE